MALDHSIFFQQRPADIMGSVSRGLDMRAQIDQRKQAEADLLRKQEMQKAYASGVKQNPDGTYTYDQNTALQALAGAGFGEQAMNIGQNMSAQQREQLKYENSLKQQEIDNELRRQQLASAAADRKEARDERRFQSGLARDEKMQALQTPYGMANTTDDAKQLKSAHESKASFDSKIQEMIDLRKKYGTEYFNREAVARGKQLSKDLLLEYKNMAKLGVLSKSDEDIINAIIPDDPLGQDFAPGQDPILSNLTKFKQDSDRDFNTRVQTRTRGGTSEPIGQGSTRWQDQSPRDLISKAAKHGSASSTAVRKKTSEIEW